jgi:hypothetical protein
VEERAASFFEDRNREYAIKRDVSEHFAVEYRQICFCGSAQLGFSVHKDRLFEPGRSDLDVACVDANLYQRAWADIMQTTRAFTDNAVFGRVPGRNIEMLKDQILRRGMINIAVMPNSTLKLNWTRFAGALGRRHADLFSSISFAIYINEYAFCWKQDSAISAIMRE